jgi:iron(III) transport system substrate-binding protein
MQARTPFVALTAAALMLVTACGSSPTATGADSTAKAGAGASAGSGVYAPFAGLTGADREQKLLDATMTEGGVLDIYTSNTDEEDLIKAFKEKYPKIKVNNFRANSETVLQRALQENSAGKTANDIMDTNDAELNAMSKEGVLAPYKGPGLDELREGSVFPDWTASRFNAFVVGWNTDRVKESEAPKSFTDLADPKWKGRLSLELGDWDWYLAMHTYLTEKKGMSDQAVDDLFTKIVGNAKVVKGHTVQGELLTAGQFDVALSIYSHTVDKAVRDGAPLAWRPPVEPVIIRPNGVGLMAHARHPAAALLWMDWVLTAGQKVIAEATRVPAAKSVPGFKDPIPEGAVTYDVPQELITKSGSEWSKKYDDLIRNAPKAG